MRTFADASAVACDARRRLQRVTIFFEALFVIVLVGLFALDRVPPRPRLACEEHEAQTMSRYPHPYGVPPPFTWTTCVWR